MDYENKDMVKLSSRLKFMILDKSHVQNPCYEVHLIYADLRHKERIY